MKDRIFLGWILAGALVSAGAARADGAGVAEVKRTASWDLIATEITSAKVVGLQRFGKNDYGVPKSAIRSAMLDLKALVEPNGCDATYAKEEIIGDMKHGDLHAKDQDIKILFGTLRELNTGQACVGLGPRPVHLKVPLVNGIGAYFKAERVIRFRVDGPVNPKTGTPDRWVIPVSVNQEQGILEVGQIGRETDEPVIPGAYVQKFECDFSGFYHKDIIPPEHRIEILLTKKPGDVEDTRNYSAKVRGQSENFFGAGSGPQEFDVVGDGNKPQWGELKLVTSGISPEFGITVQTDSVGWMSGGQSSRLIQGDNRLLGSCRVLNVQAVSP